MLAEARRDARLIARALAWARWCDWSVSAAGGSVSRSSTSTAFFSAFHGLFFAEGTWTFPSDSVLIRLFPESFWTMAGVTWAALVGLIARGYGLASWVLGTRVSGVRGR